MMDEARQALALAIGWLVKMLLKGVESKKMAFEALRDHSTFQISRIWKD